MKERALELKAEAGRGTRAKKNKVDGERDVLGKIAEMPEPDRDMFGFSDKPNLDDRNLWPASFALKRLTAAEEATIGALVKKAVS